MKNSMKLIIRYKIKININILHFYEKERNKHKI